MKPLPPVTSILVMNAGAICPGAPSGKAGAYEAGLLRNRADNHRKIAAGIRAQ